MRIKNNRRAVKDYIIIMLISVFIVGIFIFLNLINNNPNNSFSFYAIIIGVFGITPLVLTIIEYTLTARIIAIEEKGVAQYNRKGDLVKLLIYDKIEYIEVRKNKITIFSSIKTDFPYLNIITFITKSLFKFLTSKDFRKRWTEYRIDFKNYKEGFNDVELPFITEIAKRSGCKINYIES